MLLGKRPRPPMRRTASMTGITVDVSHMEVQEPPSDHFDGGNSSHVEPRVAVGGGDNNNNSSGLLLQHQSGYLAMVSPRYGNHQGSSDHLFVETAQFLRTCGLCNRRLVTGRDIYMYRGDTAFCSLECREQQIKQDEKKEKRRPPTIARSTTR